MEAFEELRKKARELRDNTIANARENFNAAMERIDELELQMTGEGLREGKSLSASIQSVMPFDRTFTIAEILKSLETLYPNRIWTHKQVNHRIGFLCDKGVLQRVSKAHRKYGAVYARNGVDFTREPDAPSLTDQLASALAAGGPMDATTLAITLIERGYKTSSSRSNFRTTISRLLRAAPKRFARAGGVWSLVS